MDPRKTALVLLEYQNDFASEGGVLHNGVKAVMASTNMLANTAKVIPEARKAGVRVMFSPIHYAAGYREIAPTYGILTGAVEGKGFLAGSWGAEIVSSLPREESDIIIEGKRGIDPFLSTNLEYIVRSLGIETLVIAGFATNVCVESAARTAYDKGFDVIVLGDCTATFSEEAQRFTLETNLPMYAHVTNHRDFLAQLSAAAKATKPVKA